MLKYRGNDRQMMEKIAYQAAAVSGAATASPMANPRRGARLAALTGASAEERHSIGSVLSVIGFKLPNRCADGVHFAPAIQIIRRNPSINPYRIAAVWQRSSGGKPSPVQSGARFSLLVLAVAAGFAGASPAAAQDLPVGSPEGLLEQGSPEGLRLGTLRVYPRINADLRYDSNVYNLTNDKLDDTVAVIQPRVKIATDWSRHALTLDASGEVRRHFKISEEDSEQFAVRGSGQFDLGSRITFAASALAASRIERRGTQGDIFRSDKPIEYDERSASLGLSRTGARLEMRAMATYSKFTYDDAIVAGAPVDLSARDVRRIGVGLRTDYAVSARSRLFVALSGNKLHYLKSVGLNDRDSKGVSVLGGIKYDLTDLLNFEAGVGVAHQDFDDPARKSFTGLAFNLAGKWSPRPRLQLALKASRSVERSSRQGAEAVVETTATAQATYAMGDRMLVTVETGFVGENYRGLDRKDNRFFGELRVRYALTPQLGAFAGVGYRKQERKGLVGRDYDGMTARVGLGFAL